MKTSPSSKALTAMISLMLLAACSGSKPSRVSFAKHGAANGTPDRPGNGSDQPSELGEEDGTGTPKVEETPPLELKFKLSDADDSDAYENTFGAAKIVFESDFKKPKITLKRSILSKQGSALTEEQKAFAVRLCKDIDLSASAKAFEAPKEDSEELYLVWRSHFGADVKNFLADYLAKEAEPIACAVTVIEEEDGKKAAANIVLNALADKDTDLVGSQKMEDALKEGLLLASSAKVEKFDNNTLTTVSEPAKIDLKIPALNSSDVSLAEAGTSGETCYLVANGATTAAYNPKSKSTASYNVTAKSEFTAGAATLKVLAGRMIKECSSIKVEGKDAALTLSLTCGDYFALKDQGLEAGCAWDVPVANKADPENTVAAALTLSKFNVKTRDGSKISAQTSDSTIPISGINEIRDGKTNVSALSKGQAQLVEDALDLWIAIDEKTYRESYYNHIIRIKWDGGCNYGAYAYFGADEFTWCAGGALTENYTSRRFQDPSLLLYRSITAYHETRHTLNWQHDHDDKSYKPCGGTAASAILPTKVITNCNFDFCKSLKPIAAGTYKNELNYDYDGDNTGRKSQGDCKAWSGTLGVTGGGF